MSKVIPSVEAFARYARAPSSAAARANLQAGRSISFVTADTPPGYVMRKHPDGRIEKSKVDFGKLR